MIALLLACAMQAPAQAKPAESVPPKLALERWQVDARFSTVGFDGESTVHDFTGKTHAVTGEVRFDPGSVATCAGGAVWIEARTLDTDNSSRDEDMQKALDVATFPQIVFTLDRVVGTLADGRGDLDGNGRFNVKGVEATKDFHFKVEPAEGGTLHVVGDAKLKLSEHAVKPPRVLFIKVKDNVRVWFDLRLAKTPEKLVKATLRTIEIHRGMSGDVANDIPDTQVVFTNATRQDRLWVTENGVLWEGPGERPWGLLVGDKLIATDPRSGKTRVLDPTVATAVKPKKANMTPRMVLIETENSSLLADTFTGNERVVALLIAAGIAPEDLLPTYWPVRGVPSSLSYSLIVKKGRIDASMTGTSGFEVQIPSWALEPESWLRAPEIPSPTPKTVDKKHDGDDR